MIFFTSPPSLSTVEIQFGRLEGEKSKGCKLPERKEEGNGANLFPLLGILDAIKIKEGEISHSFI